LPLIAGARKIPSSTGQAVEENHGLVSEKELLGSLLFPVGAVYDRAQLIGLQPIWFISETSCAVIDRAYRGTANLEMPRSQPVP